MRKKDREIVFNMYGGKCAYCGCELQKGWHVDHVEPCERIYKRETVVRNKTGIFGDFQSHERVLKFKGYGNEAANHIDNYLPSCPSCNINKHGDSIEGFRKSISGYLNSLNLRMVQYKMVKKYGLVEETNKPVVFYFEKDAMKDNVAKRQGSVANESE